MDIANIQARYGLSATVTPTGTNTSGDITVGVGLRNVNFDSADVVYSLRAILCGSTNELALNLAENDTTGSTAFVAGTAQVDTATIVAASGATSAGDMVLVLTSAGMTGSPLNVPVVLTTAMNTAALVATAARTALEAVSVVAERFTIGGTGAEITRTRKPTSTFTVPGGTLNLYPANDATDNLAIPSGLGITAAATSADTTAGVATSGTKIYDGDGKDVEGVAIPTIGTINGLLISNASTSGGCEITNSSEAITLNATEILQRIASAGLSYDTLIATNGGGIPQDITLTVVGTV